MILRGQGLVLRPLELDRDLAAMHAILGDPVSAAFLARPATEDPQGTRFLLQQWDTAPQWAITRDGGEALGRITLMTVRYAVGEIGVMVVPAHRGQGLATRAVIALTEHALAAGRIRVSADIDPDNTASIRTFERAGFVLEGHLRHNWLTHKGPADSLIYAATEGWTVPERLSARDSTSESR